MSEATTEVRLGRPSRHPELIRYREDATVLAVMRDAADRQGLTLSEIQRIVNRAGIAALQLTAEA